VIFLAEISDNPAHVVINLAHLISQSKENIIEQDNSDCKMIVLLPSGQIIPRRVYFRYTLSMPACEIAY
jgi:hypothetical protein